MRHLETQPPAGIPARAGEELLADNRILLARRARFSIHTLFVVNAFFAIADLVFAPEHLAGLYSLKALQVALLFGILLLLRTPRGRERVALLSVLGTAAVHVLIGMQAALIGDQAASIIASLMIGLFSAAVLPWSTGAQIWTALAAAATMAAQMAWSDRPAAVEPGYLHIAALGVLVAPVILSHMFERDRRALWRMTWALREADREHRELAENVQDVFWVCDPRFREIHYLSPAFEAVVGHPREPILSSPAKLLECIHEEDREAFVANLRRITLGEPGEAEYRIVRADGSLRWIWGRGFPIRDEQGAVARMAGTWRDVTDRKRVEEALRTSEERSRQILENSRDIVVYATPRGRVIYVSQVFEELTGLVRDALYDGSQGFLDVVHPEDRGKVAEAVQAAGQGEYREIEARFRHRDGSWHWMWGWGDAIRGEDGSIDRLMSVWRDTDERRRADQALRESERRFRELAENIRDIFWIWDSSFRLDYLSPAFEDFAGVAPARIHDGSVSVASLIHPEDRERFFESLRVMSAGEYAERSGRVLRADGSVRWFSARGWPIRDESGKVYRFVGIWHDITDQRRAEAERAALLAVAQDAGGTLDLERILERVHQRLRELIPCDSALTFRWDSEREAYRPLAEQGARALHSEIMSLEFALDAPMAGRLGEGTLLCNDIHEQPWLPAELLRFFGVGAYMATPLEVRGGRAIGAIFVFNGRKRPFDEAQIPLFEGIARQLSLAMEASDLYRQQKQDAHLSATLSRFGEEIIAQAGAADLPDQVCRAGAVALDCDVFNIYLVEEAEEAIVPAASFGLSPQGWETLRLIRYPLSAVSALIEVLERDGYGDVPVTESSTMLPAPAIQQAASAGLTRMVFVPLRHGGRLLGIFGACYRGRRDAFTAEQRQIAAGIARVVPLALETARLLRELEKANTVRSHFTATLSHELRNLIAALRGYTFVLRSGRRLGEQDARTVELAENCARELGELVNQTLDLSRFEARRVPLDLESVDLAALIEELAREVAPLAAAKGLQVERRVEPGLSLRSDSLKLKMILRNLLTNAIKFTERGSVAIDVQAEEAGVSLFVRDSGVGIPEEALASIFEPFEQAHGARSRRLGGAGLGLYLVRRLSSILGGVVSVESELGRGATFHVWLPRDPEQAPAGAPTSGLERARRAAALRNKAAVEAPVL